MTFDEWWNHNNTSIRCVGEQVLMGRLELRAIFLETWQVAYQQGREDERELWQVDDV